MAASRREHVALAVVLAVGLALRIAAVVGMPHAPESDELAYQSMALNLIGGHGVVDNYGNHAMYNVGYPLFVLTPAFLVSTRHLLAARLLNLVLGGISILLCYDTARQAGAGRAGRLLAAGIWAFYLPASVYVVYLAKENLMTPLMLGAIWCALRMARELSWTVAATCGVLFGLLALVGNAALFLAGAVVVALRAGPGPIRRKLECGLLIGLIAGAVTVPWLARNDAVLGAPVLNTNGGFNLYLGNNPAATGWFMSISDTPRGASWEALRKAGEVQASEVLERDAISWIEQHPARFLSSALRKAVYFWTPPLHAGSGPQSTTEKAMRVIWAIQFIAIMAVAVAGLGLGQLRSRQTAILWVGTLSYTAVYMLFYVIFRYREPIMPLAGILAAMAVEAAWRGRRVAAMVQTSQSSPSAT